MKKLLFFFMIVLCSSCVCTLSQIPPQFIYAGENCSAPLPNYVEQVTVTDNCALAQVIQTPSPGFLLSSTNQLVSVTIKATDVFNNSSQVSFTVQLLDTIPPVINGMGLEANTYNKIDEMYNRADRMIASHMDNFDETFPYEQFGLTRDSQDSTFYKYGMMVWTYPAHAINGIGSRYWTFHHAGDTLVLYNHY